MSMSPVRPVILDHRKQPCPLSFEELKVIARNQNVVLEREQKTICGERTNYDMYSNTHFVGEGFKTLTDVWTALVYDPNFQKEPRK